MPSLAVNGTTIHYAEEGAGEPVVFVHGTLNDQRYWKPQMAAFGARYRAIAISLRHYWPEQWDGVGEDFKIDQHVADTAAFCAALGAPVRLVGHSRGGHIAFRIAEARPAWLRALVLAEPGGELDESLGGAAGARGQAAAFAEAAQLLMAGDKEAALRRVAEHTGGPGAWERRAEDRKAMNRDNAMTLIGQRDERRRPYSRAAAEAITAPTLLVGGDRTLPNFNANLDALERTVRGAERVTIPDAAHAMSQDNPSAFNAAVLDFVAGH
ncbi:MAG TPA: alpha/beta hydrolase [Acetobacteraceae bacterium]|nr:alpha/beta hydrolase [Acetobacteraceae bacterium]